MAGFDYGRMQALARSLLGRYGRTMTLHRMVNGVRTTSEAVTGAMFAYTAYERAASLIDANDRRLFLAASDLSRAPTVADQITAGTDDFAIVSVGAVDPSIGTPVVYELQVRA